MLILCVNQLEEVLRLLNVSNQPQDAQPSGINTRDGGMMQLKCDT